jgi:phage shock protein PspC (stress-responsive transcriptional regulator)
MDEKEKEQALEDLKVIKKVIDTTNIKKRLYRSPTARQIAGVCGGLAEHYGMEPWLVRGMFFLFTLLRGAGPLIYVILWVAVPLREKTTEEEAGLAIPIGDRPVGTILKGIFRRRRLVKTETKGKE